MPVPNRIERIFNLHERNVPYHIIAEILDTSLKVGRAGNTYGSESEILTVRFLKELPWISDAYRGPGKRQHNRRLFDVTAIISPENFSGCFGIKPYIPEFLFSLQVKSSDKAVATAINRLPFSGVRREEWILKNRLVFLNIRKDDHEVIQSLTEQVFAINDYWHQAGARKTYRKMVSGR